MITRSNSGLYSSCLLKQNFPPCLSKQRKTQFSTLIVQAKILKRLYSIHKIFIFVEFMRGYLSSLILKFFFLDRLLPELKLTIYYLSWKTPIIAQKLNLYNRTREFRPSVKSHLRCQIQGDDLYGRGNNPRKTLATHVTS